MLKVKHVLGSEIFGWALGFVEDVQNDNGRTIVHPTCCHIIVHSPIVSTISVGLAIDRSLFYLVEPVSNITSGLIRDKQCTFFM